MPMGDRHKTRRSRNLALAFTLAGLAVLFFLVTLVKIQMQTQLP
jgi:hypothetical protein